MTIQLRTLINAAQEVPTPTGDVSAARGTFTATVSRSQHRRIQSRGSSRSAASRAMPSLLTFIRPRQGRPARSSSRCAGHAQRLPLGGTGNITEAVLDAIESGNAYVNVHTPTNSPGEIRGQLNVTAAVSTSLNSRQERPKPKGNVKRASGTFTATVTKSGTAGTIAWRLRFSGLTGRAAAAPHPHRPEGEPAPLRCRSADPAETVHAGRADLHGGSAEGAGDGTRLRERPHAEERGGRDPADRSARSRSTIT